MQEILSSLGSFLLVHPDWIFAIMSGIVILSVAAGAALEFVFPPFFGDTVILFGFFSAGQGVANGGAIFAAALLGSVVGAAGSYAIGRRFHAPPLGTDRLLTPDRMDRIGTWFERHGAKALVLNRFLPGIRALFLYLAGMGKMRFGRVLLWSTLGNVLWCAFLMYLGSAAGRSWDAAVGDARSAMRWVGWSVLAASAGTCVLLWTSRRRRARAATARA